MAALTDEPPLEAPEVGKSYAEMTLSELDAALVISRLEAENLRLRDASRRIRPSRRHGVEVPAEPTTPMKPSEALRLGRLVRPRQVFGDLFDGKDGACALGAMSAGGFSLDFSRPFVRCPVTFRRWRFWTRPCPAARYSEDALVIASHLNDRHLWSDDQIVAWLQSLGL